MIKEASELFASTYLSLALMSQWVSQKLYSGFIYISIGMRAHKRNRITKLKKFNILYKQNYK